MPDLPSEHERMLAEAVADEALRRSRGLRRVLTLISGAGALGGAYVGAADLGDYQVFSEVAMAGGLSLISQATESLRSENKDPDYEKNGPALIYAIAMRGGSKGKALRARWKQLMKNAIDPAYEHEIRQEDITLFDSLNPSDCLVLMSITELFDLTKAEYRNNSAVNHFIAEAPSQKFHPEQKAYIDKNGVSLSSISKMCSTAIGSQINIPVEELEWSIISRSDHTIGSLGPVKNEGLKNLFTLSLIIKDTRLHLTGHGASVDLKGIHCAEDMNGTIVGSALPSAARLARLIR